MNTERIKEIQSETAWPESVSVQRALLQVWNECDQESSKRIAELEAENAALLRDTADADQRIAALKAERDALLVAESTLNEKLNEYIRKTKEARDERNNVIKERDSLIRESDRQILRLNTAVTERDEAQGAVAQMQRRNRDVATNALNLQREVERLRGALDAYEWSDVVDGIHYCPCCSADKATGHSDWCTLYGRRLGRTTQTTQGDD